MPFTLHACVIIVLYSTQTNFLMCIITVYDLSTVVVMGLGPIFYTKNQVQFSWLKHSGDIKISNRISYQLSIAQNPIYF